MASLSKYIIIMGIIAVIIIAVLIIAYNRRLDRVVKGEVRDTHSLIPEPKETVEGVYRIVLMVIVAISFLTISAMNGRIQSLQSELNTLKQNTWEIRAQIMDLKEEIAAEPSRIVGYSYGVMSADLEAGTAELEYSVTLKQFAQDTAVDLKVGNYRAPMENDGDGTYSARITTGLFDYYTEAAFLISENGGSTVETIDPPGYLFYQYLPVPNLSCRFSSNMSFGKMTYEGEYTVFTSTPGTIEKATVTYMTGGKDLKTLDITEQVRKEEKIKLEQGLDLQHDLTFRIEILSTTGYRLVDQSVMIYEARPDLETEDFFRIYDRNGTLVWDDVMTK